MIKISPSCSQNLGEGGGRIGLSKVNDGLAVGKRRLQIIAEVDLRRYLKVRIGRGTCDNGLTHATPRTINKQLERSHRKSQRETKPFQTTTLGRRAVIQFSTP